MSGIVLGSVRLLNQAHVKEGVKNVIGCMTFFGGLAAFSQMSCKSKTSSDWWGTADKAISFFLKASIVLSLIASRPSLYFWEKIAIPRTWLEIFGPNTVFALNPWHPRHLLNITANALSAAALVKWVFDRCAPSPEALGFLVALGAFNFLTGRSTLHLANHVLHSY